jgi:putative glycerol-1-phosphate prenyltransferase
MKSSIYMAITSRKAMGKKSFAVLIDPDKVSLKDIDTLVKKATEAAVDFFFVGGSLVLSEHLDDCVQQIKKNSTIPVILFPGSPTQISKNADALLYLSLISGRNPELLIGQHVTSASMIKNSGLEIMPTGYMLIDGGAPTTVSYISNSTPIPANKNDIALATALAGEMLGMKLIYMDAGSGAQTPITESLIKTVAKNISIPLIVGGGIREAEKAYLNCKAGADVIVVGNAIEKDLSLIKEMSAAVHAQTTSVE